MKLFFHARRGRIYKFISLFSLSAFIVNMSISGMFFVIQPTKLAQADQPDLCEADTDVVLIMDRSGSMEDGESERLCSWEQWQISANYPPKECVVHNEDGLSEGECEAKPDHSSFGCDSPVFTPASNSKIEDAMNAAGSFLGNMGSSDQSALVSYASDASLDKSLSNDHSATESAVNALSTGGATNIGDAIDLANSELGSTRANPQAVKVMILLTDGRANEPNGNGEDENSLDVAYAETMATVAAGLGYKIFTIGVGDDVNDTMLINIASITGAKRANGDPGYYHYPNPDDDLLEIYNLIALQLCEYGSISGCKYNDVNSDADSSGIDSGEEKLDDWEIILDDGISTTSQMTVDGCYSFAGLENGDYAVSEVMQNGWVQSYPSLGYYELTISNHENITDIDFANYIPEVPSIATSTVYIKKFIDNVASSSAGWEMSVYAFDGSVDPATSTTLADAWIPFEITLNNATSSVQANEIQQSGYNLVDIICTLGLGGPEVGGADHACGGIYDIEVGDGDKIYCEFYNETIAPATSTISGCKYNDRNNNGLLDSGEEALDDWGIQLIQCTYTPLSPNELQFLPLSQVADLDQGTGSCTLRETATTTNGCYEFNDLSAGDYGVLELGQSGWEQTYPLNDTFYFFNLPAGTATTSIDFLNYFIPVPQPYCGDGNLDFGEECDDGNTASGDGCSAVCMNEGNGEDPYCGDGSVNQSSEECDDGNNNNGDGCSSVCLNESSSGPYCGDGTVNQSSEECDDGNTSSGDGCSSSCQNESSGGGGGFFTYTGQGETEEIIVLGEEGEPTLLIEKTIEQAFANNGDEGIEYQIIITNNGTLTAFDVILNDSLPDGLVYSGTNENLKTWNLGDIESGKSVITKYNVDVLSSAKSGVYENIARVSASNHDEVSDTASLEVREIVVLAETGFRFMEFLLLFGFALVGVFVGRKGVNI